jgi:phage terminase large subunit-like protein
LKSLKSSAAIFLSALLACLASTAVAEEMVTIRKSRLEELERKEAELEKLKAEMSAAKGELNAAKTQLSTAHGELSATKKELTSAKTENEQLKKQTTEIQAGASAPNVIVHVSPPMASLPPLKDGEVVDAMDLMNHYKADPSAADKRYKGRRMRVQGEVAAVEKPMFITPYHVVLKTTNPAWRVVCSVTAPPEFTAVYTADHGRKIMGKSSRLEPVTLVEVGQRVIIQGRCKALSDSMVDIVSGELK